MRVGGGDRRCVSSKTDHRSGPRFLAWPHRSLAAQQLGVDGAMTREMGRPHQSEGIAAQARAAPPGDNLRDGAGIGADLPPYQTANLDQLSISLCHVGNCSRGKPPTPTSDARGAVMRVTTVCVGSGGCGSGKGVFSPKLARRGHGEQTKKRFKEGPSRRHTRQPPRSFRSSLVISTLFGCHTHLSHLGLRDNPQLLTERRRVPQVDANQEEESDDKGAAELEEFDEEACDIKGCANVSLPASPSPFALNLV